MEFIRINANYWTVLLVKAVNMERILSIIWKDIEIALVPVC
jgi:hypothetical protein